MAFKHKDILGLQELSAEEIELLLNTADNMKEISKREVKKVPTLRGKTVVNLFFEPSTRTRTSFEIAAKRLSADTLNISASTSAVQKGETLSDTARNIEAMKPDIIVMRHAISGAHHYLAKRVSYSVVNAGDGSHEHPSQALLDMMTIREKLGTLKGLKVAIVGDITHSRVARSNIYGLSKMGAEVFLAGPPTLIPPGVERLGNLTVCSKMKEAVEGADVIMMLRIQLERQGKSLLPTMREYSRYFGLSEDLVKMAKPGVLVMHPGPMNRGVEISSDVADGSNSVILEQVENGVAVRMSMLYHVSGGGPTE
ncbi:MAG: aspartate carbamoyltransferase catalytic subunit [Deltaproteobacteria bacterium]|nr:aspartate carbamoyltransferase catalytic subunit [Deltaproteobacteria bacterium]